jgi:DNA-binding MurR/RpiR family transcriptional regulator
VTADSTRTRGSRESRVRALLEATYATLTSPEQRRAADYLIAHHRTVFALSVQDLAREAGVSETTLVRFARRIGFAGYLEMRAAFVEEAKQGLLPEVRFAYEAPSRAPASTLARVAQQEVENINRTHDQIDAKELRRFVTALRRAQVVMTMGLGVSLVLARLASYALFQVGVRTEVLVRDTLSLVEQVARLPRTAAVLAFAFPPYSKDTARALASAKSRGIPALLVTDGAHSPLAPHATACLFSRTENILFTNSVSGATVLINALATDLALANKARALKQLRASQAAASEELVSRAARPSSLDDVTLHIAADGS